MNNVKGFSFSGISCGIKKKGIKDLGLIFSSKECLAHAVFTKNKVIAAPLIVSKKILKKNKIKGVIVNSGNANACTGKKGIISAEKIINNAAKIKNLEFNNFFIPSTGIIGEQLDSKKIINKIPELFSKLKPNNIKDFANSILTTDKYIKIKSAKLKIGNETGTILGIAKGAGMIHPNMATMLCYLVTDIKFEKKTFINFINNATDKTFNAISVDGDTSTNDTVLGLSNGFINNSPIKSNTKIGNQLYKEIEKIFYYLASSIVKDGEGSTKFCKVTVKGTQTIIDAKKVCEKICTSLLFKTALFGSDPNWGRIIASVGATGLKYIDQSKIDIKINKNNVVKKGIGCKLTNKINMSMKKKQIYLEINLNKGSKESTMFTNDIGHEYIKINSLYRT